MILRWRQVVPSIVTVMAMLAGFLSILLTVEGMRLSGRTDLYMYAAQMIMLAMILDGIDGNLARWLKGTSDFGAELDTYVDLTAFGIAPAVLIFAVSLEGRQVEWRVILPAAVALSGMVRLARFKVKDPLRGQGGYAGLPITANAGWVALFVFISENLPMNFSLNHGKVAALFLTGIVAFTVLQITNFRYPKPTKKVKLFIPCIVLVALLFLPVRPIPLAAAIVTLCLGTAYAIFGPLFVKGVEVHKARKDAKRNKMLNEVQ